ncbi:OmpA family protein [Dyadobacter sp. CY326]|uniref:OmpA family protein n=1 Tax=Dyadobacter sp. CY326 TaxID=2907300 RepID=UPI001F44B242|nr:OmpA family protein [Dyadobacter sp. CY326]MCE7065760.1 OmpA family protein [Dyadobacter sp. CY326]
MKYIITLITLVTFLNYGNCKQNNINYIILKGACFDYNKGPNINTDVYSIIDGRKQHLGMSNKAGVYRVKVPLSSNFLVFESAGFHQIKLPVRFIGQATSEVEFLFDLPTSLSDSIIVPIEDALYLGAAKSVLKNYTVRLAKEECIVDIPKEMIDRGHRGAFMGVTEKSPSIDLLVTSSSDEIIMKKRITVSKGLNLLLIDNIQSEIMSSDEKVHNEFPMTKILYFDQTKYKLNDSSIMILDSIIDIVKPIRSYTISVTGYTDNVGERAKNLTLSEYRARIAAKYLKDKGIKESKINKKWLGSENLASESALEKNRRVVIEVFPE